MAQLWEECAEWLSKCGVVDYRSFLHLGNSPKDLESFAESLRDGVLLCKLVHQLCPDPTETHRVALSPNYSEFLCTFNIKLFLGACKSKFGLQDADLFSAKSLFRLEHFDLVLKTLSKLSKTSLALKTVPKGFPADVDDQVEEPENFYESLSSIIQESKESRIVSWINSQRESQRNHDEKIYDAVIQAHPKSSVGPSLVSALQKFGSGSEEEGLDFVDSRISVPNKSERKSQQLELCIKELTDSERTYLTNLKLVQEKFCRPMRTSGAFKPKELATIFTNHEHLYTLHMEILDSFNVAVLSCETSPSLAEAIADIFCAYKLKFVAYATYCSGLAEARQKLQELYKKKKCEKIIKDLQTASKSLFVLEDLLSVPMQRMLKYPILIEKMISLLPENSVHESTGLQHACEEIKDVSEHINEVKRDNEILQNARKIQEAIQGMELPDNVDIEYYGRRLTDGTLKMEYFQDPSSRERLLFIFEKAVLICKSPMFSSDVVFDHAIATVEYSLEINCEAQKKTVEALFTDCASQDLSHAVPSAVRSPQNQTTEI